MTEHDNWITVGEMFRLIQEPVALYTSLIVERWHTNLCCLSFGRCANAAVCHAKTNPDNLCTSCKGWYDELATSHRNTDKRQIKWRKNCDTSKWPDDPWELAKFFMPILGDNKRTVKDGESTDLSSLLNVLAWMKDVVFAPDRRVDLNLVKKLRSEVRNPWAHAPTQELTEAVLNDAFDIANKFVADLDKVFSCDEVKKCIKAIKDLQANGLTNVVETKLMILKLLAFELGGEFGQMKQDRSADRQAIQELEEKLENCMKQIKSGTDGRFQLKCCIPDKPPTFIGRDAMVKEITSSLVENDRGIVSIVGGPGFGKSTVAVEVSHNLSKNHDIVVIFSFLSTASTLLEVILRLCRDVGVNPGEDPESALMLWVKNIETKVVFVMDNIEQMLEGNVKSRFAAFVLTLRKNSRQHLKILTTTRTEFSIPGQTTENLQIVELDKKSSVELLRQCCPNEKVEDAYLSELAKLCGFVPLALCIVGTLIPDLDDPSELIQWLREEPMEALQNASQCVQQAIEFSFKMLSDGDKKTLVRLSVFNGNFRRDSAKEVIERNGLKTQNFLNDLVSRSLIQRSSDKRFVIHSLIRRFLADHDQLQDEKATAQGLMVSHFLKVCHSLTMDSYSEYNGFISARESLKKDAHNVEETLKICSQDQASNLKPSILEFLTSSDIYKSSSRFFNDFSWDLLPRTVLNNFFETCIKLAESRKQPAIEITFQCLVANQEGRKSALKSSDYNNRMEGINEMFQKNKAVLKEDRFLFMYCYYLYALYKFSKEPNSPPVPDLSKDDLAPLPENNALSCIEKAAEALVLMERGRLNKRRACKMYKPGEEKFEEYMNCAKSCISHALLLAKESLGDHELTCTLNKHLGDLYFGWHKYEEALTQYSHVTELRKKLKLDSNEPFMLLLKNYGACLSYLHRYGESVEKLMEARDIAEKLTEEHTPRKALVYCKLAISCRHIESHCHEAPGYAKAAMEMNKVFDVLYPEDVVILNDITENAEGVVDDRKSFLVLEKRNYINS